MPDLGYVPSGSLRDLGWRTAYRLGFPLARLWWRVRQPQHQGALVAVHVGADLLLLRSSYRAAWNFPGGGVRPGETPDVTVRRELAEEIGLVGPAPTFGGVIEGIFDGRPDRVHMFTLRLERLPALRLDSREIVGAWLATPEELRGMALTEPVAAYLGRPLPQGRR